MDRFLCFIVCHHLTCVSRLEVENVGLSGESIHVVHLVVFVLIAVNQVDDIIPFIRTIMAL